MRVGSNFSICLIKAGSTTTKLKVSVTKLNFVGLMPPLTKPLAARKNVLSVLDKRVFKI